MTTYRWNQARFATGYDAAAAAIHPHYVEMQQHILDLLPQDHQAEFLLVDAGGGSGRLAALFLQRFPRAQAIVVDQSEAFLALAQQRLSVFGARAATTLARLQDDWGSRLPQAPSVLVSMSAIHHLSPPEKQRLYRQMHDALAPGGILFNGDEVRPARDDDYLAALQVWSKHMQALQASGTIPSEMAEILDAWRTKNISRFGEAKHSGDDCHETIDVQLSYLKAAGFHDIDVPWQRQMWAILRAVKSSS